MSYDEVEWTALMDDDDWDGYVPPEDDLMYPYNAWQDYMGYVHHDDE